MEKTLKRLNFITIFEFLWNYMKDMKGRYLLFYLGWLFQTVVGVVAPIVFGEMINQVIYENDLAAFLKRGLVFLGITLFGIGLNYWIYDMYAYLWNGINRRLRLNMFDRLMKMSARKIESLQFGDTINMIQFWSMEGVHFMIRNVGHNLNNILRIIACITVMFVINPVFGMITLIMVPLSVFSTLWIGSRIRRNGDRKRNQYSAYIAWFYEVAASLGELRLWSAEQAILKKFERKNKELKNTSARIELEDTIGNEALANIKNVVLVIQYGLLAYYAIRGMLTIGAITVLLNYFTTMSKALSDLSSTFMDAQKRIGIIEKMRDFMEDTTDEEEEEKVSRLYDLNEPIERISFEDCSFQYDPGFDFGLRSLNFSVHAGEKVAIVGENGAGKSTLLNLLLRFYRPTSGKLLLNGKEMSKLTIESYYEHISIVFQQVMLCRGSIRDNLLMGKDISGERMVQACKAAGIYDLLSESDMGFDTILEKQGANLSGGQRQRLGIARAYLRESELVLMDEATSALDPDTEQWILDHWDEMLKGRICIVVSHRLPTIMRCDRVIMLRNGRICAMGTPETMRNECREFKELFAL